MNAPIGQAAHLTRVRRAVLVAVLPHRKLAKQSVFRIEHTVLVGVKLRGQALQVGLTGLGGKDKLAGAVHLAIVVLALKLLPGSSLKLKVTVVFWPALRLLAMLSMLTVGRWVYMGKLKAATAALALPAASVKSPVAAPLSAMLPTVLLPEVGVKVAV